MNVNELTPDHPPGDGIERHPRDGRPKVNGQWYSRPSSLGNYLEDTANLEKWKQRRAAAGFVQRPELLARIAAIGPDDTKDNKDEINRLVEEAVTAGQGDRNRELGTALHRITERIDAGENVDVPHMWRADVDAYLAATAGFEWLAVERFVVCEALHAAGTPDRYGRLPDGRVLVFDTKGGSSLVYGGLKFAIQLATYAHADYFYNPDGTIEPIPWDVDKDEGVLVHLEVGSAVCTLHSIDIAAGWEAAHEALAVRDWRRRGRKLIVPYQQRLLEPSPEAKEIAQRIIADVNLDGEKVGEINNPTTPELPPVPEPTSRNGGREDLLDYTRARVAELVEAGHRDRLIATWKEEKLPSIHPDAPPVTSGQLEVIATILTEIEHDVDRYVNGEEIQAMRDTYARLTDGQRAAFDQWLAFTKWNPTHRLTRNRADTVADVLQELRSSRAK